MATPRVDLTGIGKIGDVKGDWTITETAFPVVPGDSTGSTTTASLGAVKENTSKFILGQKALVTHPQLGAMPGDVTSVDPNNSLTVGFAVASTMTKLNVERNIPAVASGHPLGAVDLAMQLLGGDNTRPILTSPSGRFWSLNGHSAGFDINGKLLHAKDVGTGKTPLGNFLLVDTQRIVDAVQVYPFAVVDPYGLMPSGVVLPSFDWMNMVTEFIFEAFIPAGVSVGFRVINQLPGARGGQAEKRNIFEATIVPGTTTGSVILTNTFYDNIASAITPTTVTVPISPNTPLGDRLVRVHILLRNSTVQVRVNDGGLGSPAFSVTANLAVTNIGPITRNVSFTGQIRNLYQRSQPGLPATLSAASPYWSYGRIGKPEVRVADYGTVSNKPIIGRKMNLLEYLKEVTAALGAAIGYVAGGSFYISRVGRLPTDLDLTNVIGKPRITESANGASRTIKVVNQNATKSALAGTFLTIYDAQLSGDSFSIETGETKVVRISLDGFADVLQRPIVYGDGADQLGFYQLWLNNVSDSESIGSFWVSDANKIPLTGRDWALSGADVTVELVESNDAVDITFIGPPADIPGAPGPYTFGVYDGADFVPTFRLAGAGVLSKPTEITLYTGVDETQVTQEVGPTIDNCGLADLEMVMDRTVWSLEANSSPTLKLSFTMPTDVFLGLGFAQNSTFLYEEKRWQVISATFSALTTAVDAIPFTLLDDYDAVWLGSTLDDKDAEWVGYTLDQRSIESLRRSS